MLLRVLLHLLMYTVIYKNFTKALTNYLSPSLINFLYYMIFITSGSIEIEETLL